MQLTLQPDDADILHTVLVQTLADLRMEIAGTEDYDARRELHEREDALRRIIAHLEQRTETPAGIGMPEGHRPHHYFVQRPGD
jgi:hypothetical protein